MGGSSSSMDQAPPEGGRSWRSGSSNYAAQPDYGYNQRPYSPPRYGYQDRDHRYTYYDAEARRGYYDDQQQQQYYYQQPPPPQHQHQHQPYHSRQSSHASSSAALSEPYNRYPSRPQSPPRPAAVADYRSRQSSKFRSTYSKIGDEYSSLDEVVEALAEAGLESSNLIVGVDFTKSNEWTGKESFNRQCLHRVISREGGGELLPQQQMNPYEQAISIIGRTLASFDEDNLIPCFGFGDASTHDQDVFSFYPDGRPCLGFEEALERYREIVPNLKLAGPTSFAPIIETAITIVENSGGQYHVLLIIADGQVTRSVNTEFGQLSPQEQKTVEALVEASNYPLSIILVGVGDGPWDMMEQFDDNIPTRQFDNFQFVKFTDIMLNNMAETKKETTFALASLMEIPMQYKATLELGILGRSRGTSPQRIPLPTPSRSYNNRPLGNILSSNSTNAFTYNTRELDTTYDRAPTRIQSTSSNPSSGNQNCSICFVNPKNMAFGCGHQACQECGQTIQNCHICRQLIELRIKLYS